MRTLLDIYLADLSARTVNSFVKGAEEAVDAPRSQIS